jgi:rRNA maturation RNase YbeY
MNKKFFGHDSLTDIITFPMHDPLKPISADIYISVERVRENSYIFRIPFQLELFRILIHGALHLCGYKDKSKSEKSLMRKREEIYLDMFHVK